MRFFFVVLLLVSASSVGAQELPKATPEGQKALDELFRLCVAEGGLKEIKTLPGPGPSKFVIGDLDRLKVALKTRRALITPKARDALIARWGEVDQSQQPTITSILDLIGDIADDDTAGAFAAFLAAFNSVSRQDFDKGISLFERAALLFKKSADRRWEAGCLSNIGFAYYRKGEHDKAIAAYEKALEIQRAVLGDKSLLVAISLGNIGSAYDAKGEHDKAIEYLEKSLVLKRAVLGDAHPSVAKCLNGIGSAYDARGEFDKGIKYHEKALAIQRAMLGDKHSEVAASLNNIGTAYDGKGEHDKAIEYHRKALAISIVALGEKHPDVATCLNNIGLAYDGKGEHDKAIEYYEKALTIVLAVFGDKHPTVAVNLNNIGSAYLGKGEHDKAVEYYEKALAIRRAMLGDKHPDVASSLNNIGSAYDSKGEYDAAVEYYQKALAIQRTFLGDAHPYVASSLNNIGSAYDAKGEHEKAIEYHKKALVIQRAMLGDKHPDVATSLDMIGNGYNDKDELEKALEYYENALAIRRAVLGDKNPDVALSFNNIGTTYNRKGEHDKAVEFHEQALAIRRAVLGDMHPAVAVSLGNMGTAYACKGENAKAIEYFEKALAIRRAVYGDRHPDIALNLNNIGLAFKSQGEHGKAAEAFRKALRTLTVVGKGDPNQTTFLVDELLLLPQTATAARSYAFELESDFESIPDRARLKECLAAYRLASDVIERLREKNLETKESKLALGEKHSDMFPAWIGAAARYAKVDGTPKGPIQAFEAAERGTSRVFLEELGRRNAKRVGKVDRTTLDAERKIESAVDVVDAKIAVEEKKPLKDRDIKKLANLLDERAKLEKDLRALIARMEKDFPLYAALQYPKACTLDQARASLDENEIALMFVVGKEKSYLVMLRPLADDKTSGISIHQLPGESEIGKIVASLTFPATIKSNVLAREKGKQAYDAWLGSVAKEIAGKNLLIVPSGPLGNVPFEMLVEQDKDDAEKSVWLVENHRIRYTPSLTILHVVGLWDKNRERPNRNLWALGDPIFNKDDERLTKVKETLVARVDPATRSGDLATMFRRLTATGAEVQAIDALLQEEKNVVAINENATESAFKHASESGELKKYRFIHLATHGMLGSKKNEPPALVFGLEESKGSSARNDGFLRLDEVSQLNLNADLVALSACQTGQGQNRKGEGVTSMARAFLLAGSRDVLCSLWSVDDAKTADLMTTMYSHLKEHDNVPDALRAAQLQMIDRSLPPFYWAAFIASGR